MAKKLTAEKTPDQVWLAGLGALVIAEEEGNDLFQQLLRRGEEFKQAEAGAQDVQASSEVPVTSMRSLTDEMGRLLHVALASENRRSAAVDHRRKQSAPMDLQEVRARQARRLESARRAFLKEFGTPQEEDRDCERLKRDRKIFTVIHRNSTYVPSFQFDEKGRPRPAVAAVIRALGKKTSDWGLALWFTASDGWLDGRRPVDLLKDEPERVVEAAEREAEELVF